GVGERALVQDLKQPPPGMECPNEVGEYSGVFLDLRYLVEEGLGVMAGQSLGLGLTDELYDVVVAGLAQLLLGPEVMDDQSRGDPGVFGDGTPGNTQQIGRASCSDAVERDAG